MTATAAHNVLTEALESESFIAKFRQEPEKVLDKFDLSKDERRALLSGDESKIREILGDAKAALVVVIVIGGD